KMKNKKEGDASRRRFLRNIGLGLGSAAIVSTPSLAGTGTEDDTGEKVKVLTSDGKLVEVSKSAIKVAREETKVQILESQKGLPHRKFVMVIDLAKCKNARKCVDACQEGHMLPKDHEWIQIYLLQDSDKAAKYWFPRPCYHCDSPLCVSVCPVGATYKREDGIVIVNSKRCIGCKFCMTACPYSARVFHWKDPEAHVPEDHVYDPELNVPPVEGTVGKCVFCADKLRNNELPRCVKACPMGVIYFGDLAEDAVTNGVETLRFSSLMVDKHGYRYMEELGTMPSVYYLPPVNRTYPVELGFEDLDPSISERYKTQTFTKDKNK
ncbi:MAG: 4Fe-4S dicluster domain-containing protein, partial [Bacteroidales bacterium]|nr:4Fe-4S dicluster domain-containing protein [Bacteroidales bacterium]